jgi:hypothetical protein
MHDAETRRRGDAETRRRGDMKEKEAQTRKVEGLKEVLKV